MFYRSLFVLLYFFFWQLCCPFFFDLRILITPLGIFNLFLAIISACTVFSFWRFCQCSQKNCLYNTIDFHLSLNRSHENELSVIWVQASLWFLLQELPIYVMFFTWTRLRETICRGLHTHYLFYVTSHVNL